MDIVVKINKIIYLYENKSREKNINVKLSTSTNYTNVASIRIKITFQNLYLTLM